MKKVFSVLCVCALLLGMQSMMTMTASAETLYAQGKFSYGYEVSNGKATLIHCMSNADSPSTLSVPSTLGGYPVTKINNYAFEWCTAKTIVIPASVKSLGEWTFCQCTNLTSVTVAKNNTEYCSIGGVVFTKNKKTLVAYPMAKSASTYTVPSSVTKIGDAAFYNCKTLKNAVLPAGLKTVGAFAFGGAKKLQSVTLPSGVTKLGMAAFNGSEALQSIVIPKGLTSIEEWTFLYTDLQDVYYGGSQSAWEAMAVSEGNNDLYAATKHYNQAVFNDVTPNAWYYSAVQYVAKRGQIKGYTDGSFRPTADMTRQDFVVVLARVSGANLSSYQNKTGGFSDVKKDSYYAPAVAWAVDKGIIKGYNSREFGVGDPLTREQVATILYRYKKSPSVSNVSGTLSQFTDRSKINAYAKNATAWAVKQGIITGKGSKFAPQDKASRAQIAAIIARMDKQNMF